MFIAYDVMVIFKSDACLEQFTTTKYFLHLNFYTQTIKFITSKLEKNGQKFKNGGQASDYVRVWKCLGFHFVLQIVGVFSHVSDSIPTEQTYDLIRHYIKYSTSQSFLTWIGQQNVQLINKKSSFRAQNVFFFQICSESESLIPSPTLRKHIP